VKVTVTVGATDAAGTTMSDAATQSG